MMNEKTYLNSYDKADFSSPLLTVDAVIFTYYEHSLKVLLVQRSIHPEKDKWALPGGFIDENKDQNLEATVQRKLVEKTGISAPYIEQLISTGSASRDKRGWSVTVAYTALIAHQNCASHINTVADTRWVNINEALGLDLAFDHHELLRVALNRLRQKALYSIVPAFTLPDVFTLPELQHVHEVLIGKALQKKSFRRRIEQAALLEEVGERTTTGKGRPAMLYRMKPKASKHTFLRNLDV